MKYFLWRMPLPPHPLFKIFTFYYFLNFYWSPTGGYSLLLKMALLTKSPLLHGKPVSKIGARAVFRVDGFSELFTLIQPVLSKTFQKINSTHSSNPGNLLYLCKSSHLASPLAADWRAHQFFQTFDARLLQVWVQMVGLPLPCSLST